jgi:flagellar motor switch protein FliN/FliY
MSPNAGTTGGATPANLERYAVGFFEGAGPALTTVLNRPVTAEVTGVASTTSAALVNQVPPPWVLVEIVYQRGMTGTQWLLFDKAAALALAAALGGDDAVDEEMRARHEEVLRETVNQVLTGSAAALLPLFARSVAFAPVSVRKVEEVDGLPAPLTPSEETHLWVARAEAHSGDGFRAEFTLLMGRELAEEIVALGAPAAPETEAPKDERLPSTIDLILDVTLPVAVELGRSRMQIQDILKLAPGSVIELDKSAGDPVELFINDRPIAKGEVVIIDENFGVRLTSIVTATERIKTLR